MLSAAENLFFKSRCCSSIFCFSNADTRALFDSFVQGFCILSRRVFMDVIQHCFICRLSDSTLSEDAGIEKYQMQQNRQQFVYQT
jgi:hypothetical protein